MLHISACQWLADYKLALIFDNGIEGVVDLDDLIEEDVIFAPLKNKEIFKNVELRYGGVTTWLNGLLDIAPEYLFFLMNKCNPKFHDLFTKWGYL